jgi:hypothetical protein
MVQRMIVCCAIFFLAVTDTKFIKANDADDSLDHNVLGSRIQQIFNIRDSGSDVLKALKEAITDLGKGPGIGADAGVDSLVQALLRGGDPDGLWKLVVARAHITDKPEYVAPGDVWDYGTARERRQLAMHLWKVAQASAPHDPKKGQDYARAAVLLAAHEGFRMGPWAVHVIITPLDHFVSIAALTADQGSALFDVDKGIKGDMQRSDDVSTTAMDATDMLTTHPEKSAVDSTKDALVAIGKWRAAVMGNLAGTYEVIYELWTLRNIARQRGSDESLSAVNEYLKVWREGVSSPTLARWLDEAKTTSGAAPKVARVMHIDTASLNKN